MNFESALKRLEEIVQSLEKGDVPLETSLKLFEEGTKMINLCNETLANAEQKIVKLTKGVDGNPIEEKFDVEGL